MAFTKIHFSLGTYKKRNVHLVMLLKKYLLPALFVIAEAISDLPSQNVSVITSKRKILSNFADQVTNQAGHIYTTRPIQKATDPI